MWIVLGIIVAILLWLKSRKILQIIGKVAEASDSTNETIFRTIEMQDQRIEELEDEIKSLRR